MKRTTKSEFLFFHFLWKTLLYILENRPLYLIKWEDLNNYRMLYNVTKLSLYPQFELKILNFLWSSKQHISVMNKCVNVFKNVGIHFFIVHRFTLRLLQFLILKQTTKEHLAHVLKHKHNFFLRNHRRTCGIESWENAQTYLMQIVSSHNAAKSHHSHKNIKTSSTSQQTRKFPMSWRNKSKIPKPNTRQHCEQQQFTE